MREKERHNATTSAHTIADEREGAEGLCFVLSSRRTNKRAEVGGECRLNLVTMKQRAAKKKQTKKVKAAKRKQKEAKKQRAAAAAGGGGGIGGGGDDKDGDVAMDAEVAAADEEVAIAEAEAEAQQAKPSGRAAHALKVQARRALKTKLESLKGARQKIAKKNVQLKPERKAISKRIKGLMAGGRAGAGDAAELLAAAQNLPDDDDDDDDEWEEYDGADDDVEMAA